MTNRWLLPPSRGPWHVTVTGDSEIIFAGTDATAIPVTMVNSKPRDLECIGKTPRDNNKSLIFYRDYILQELPQEQLN